MFHEMNLTVPRAYNDQHIECPLCKGAMRLVRTKPAIAGKDLRMFECLACECVQVMSYDPRTSISEWVMSGTRRHG